MKVRIAEEMGVLLENLQSFKEIFERYAPEISQNSEELRTIVACLDRMLADYFSNPPKDGAEVEKFFLKHREEFNIVPGKTGEFLFELCSNMADKFFDGPVEIISAEDGITEVPMDDYILYCRNLTALCAGDPIKTVAQFQNPQKYSS